MAERVMRVHLFEGKTLREVVEKADDFSIDNDRFHDFKILESGGMVQMVYVTEQSRDRTP